MTAEIVFLGPCAGDGRKRLWSMTFFFSHVQHLFRYPDDDDDEGSNEDGGASQVGEEIQEVHPQKTNLVSYLTKLTIKSTNIRMNDCLHMLFKAKWEGQG